MGHTYPLTHAHAKSLIHMPLPQTLLAIFLFFSFQSFNCFPVQCMEIHTSGYFSFHMKWTTRWLLKVLPIEKTFFHHCLSVLPLSEAAMQPLCISVVCPHAIYSWARSILFPPSSLSHREFPQETTGIVWGKGRKAVRRASTRGHAVYLCLLTFRRHLNRPFSFYTGMVCTSLSLWCKGLHNTQFITSS